MRGVGLRRGRIAAPGGPMLDQISPSRGLVPPQPAAASPGLSEQLLNSPIGRVVEGHAGDLCSLLGIVGAAVIFVNHRGAKAPNIERLGVRTVMGSMAAAGVDAGIQARNVLVDDGAGAEQRGNTRSSWGSVAYAATGLIPAASLRALRGLHRHPSVHEVVALGALGVNGGVLGYELVTRTPAILRGDENASGYGSLLASLGGFVVARRFAMRG